MRESGASLDVDIIPSVTDDRTVIALGRSWCVHHVVLLKVSLNMCLSGALLSLTFACNGFIASVVRFMVTALIG